MARQEVDAMSKTLVDLELGKRNPRVLVAEANRHLKALTNSIAYRWATSPQTYDMVDGKAAWRRKVGMELPENDPVAWQRLAQYARVVRYIAEKLERFANEQHKLAQERAGIKPAEVVEP